MEAQTQKGLLLLLLLVFLVRNVFADSLDGYSFSCGARVNFQQGPPHYGFVGDNEVWCPDAFGTSTYQCGSYSYSDGGASFSLTLNDQLNYVNGTFQGRDLQFVDGILVSFMTDNAQQTLPCTVQALDWRKLEQGSQTVFFSCSPQNAIPGTSYEDNSFSFYNTGYVHFQSNFEIVSGNGNTIRRDYHGVFVWDPTTEYVKLYAGPQAGEGQLTLDGSLSQNGDLFINGFSQENNFPCRAQTVVSVLPSGSDYPVPVNLNNGNDNGDGNDEDGNGNDDADGNDEDGNGNDNADGNDEDGNGNDNADGNGNDDGNNNGNEAESAALGTDRLLDVYFVCLYGYALLSCMLWSQDLGAFTLG